MTLSTLQIQTGPASYVDPSEAISASVLGGEYLGWESVEYFKGRQAEVGFSHIRWPGGIVAEDGIDTDNDGVRDPVYALTHPDIVANWPMGGQDRPGLTAMFEQAVSAESSFAMLIPTSTYVQTGIDQGREAGVAQARADIRAFVERMAAGEFGDVPSDLTLEIGSEYYATRVWKSKTDKADLPTRFGEIFAAQVDEVAKTIADLNANGQNPLGIDPMLAVQMGRFQSADDVGNSNGQFTDNQAFIDAFNSAGALDQIDALIWHRYVPSFDRIGLYTERPVAGGYSDAQNSLFQTSWDLWSGATGRDLDLVAGWMSPAIQRNSNPEFGAPGLSNILQMFATMVDLGADVASIYGLGVQWSGTLAYRDEVFLGGQLYQMMSEALAGTYLHDGYQANLSPLEGGAYRQTTDVNSYVFEDSSKLVIFLAARDLPGQATHTISVDQAVSYAWAQHLWDPGELDVISTQQVGVVGETRSSGPLQITQTATGAQISVTFSHDFEVVRLILAKETGGEAGVFLRGGADDDVLTGGLGDDRLEGMAGDDTLIAGSGTDLVDGGAGTDLLRLDAPRTAWQIDVSEDGNTVVLTGQGNAIEARGVEVFEFGGEQIGRADLLASNLISLPGTAGNDRINGTNADEHLDGLGGDDRLYGQDGNDRLTDGAGRDNLFGGAGADTFAMSNDSDADSIKDFQNGSDRIDLSAWNVYALDQLELSAHKSGKTILRFDDEVLAISHASGGGLTDLDASDFIFTERPANKVTLTGTAADDRMIGTAADEILIDGGGRDNLFGKDGADVFVLVADGDADAIKDFDAGQDLIDVSAWGVSYADLDISLHHTGKAIVRSGDEALSVNDGARTMSLSDLLEDAFIF